MIASYIDCRSEFFAILSEKLGQEFSLRPHTDPCFAEGLEPDVIIVGVPTGIAHVEIALKRLRTAVLNPDGIPVLAFLGERDRTLMREVISAGAYDYFVESDSMEELGIVLRRAAEYYRLRSEVHTLRQMAATQGEFGIMISADCDMINLFNFAKRIAASDATVLITGETGTGKELLARAIHDASQRAAHPFVAVACSSLPETLIEAELFGHEKGAFTSAIAARRGRFEAAERGTIFLDEVGELSPALQIKLLRVLQECKFERIGSNDSRLMQARVLCATNRDLKAMVAERTFRADLFYRLNTIELCIPPLRERPSDIRMLAAYFLQRFANSQARPARRFSEAAMCALECYCWPGNVRELEHVVERSVLLCDSPDVLIDHLPKDIVPQRAGSDLSSLGTEMRRFKRTLIQRTLNDNNFNKKQAARSLRISRSSLHRLIEELNIPGNKTA